MLVKGQDATNKMDENSRVDERFVQLEGWLKRSLPWPIEQIKPLQGDASFRRYFRVTANIDGVTKRYIAMDAPPAKESCKPFVDIAKILRNLGVEAPIIYEQSLEHGFLLLSDYGDTLYSDVLNAESADHFYGIAMDALLLIQSYRPSNRDEIPAFDQTLYDKEAYWFTHWYVKEYLEIDLNADEQAMLTSQFEQLIFEIEQQPKTLVHRDYHSRNLMVLPDDKVGIIDFQDAVWGPVTYDLMSLLRDCYIDWPSDRVEARVLDYKTKLIERGILEQPVDDETFLRWFYLSALQRHLKCLGNFAKLYKDDNKPGYLQYLPRVLNYSKEITQKYAEYVPLHHFLVQRGRT